MSRLSPNKNLDDIILPKNEKIKIVNLLEDFLIETIKDNNYKGKTWQQIPKF